MGKKEWDLTLGVMPPTAPVAPTAEPPSDCNDLKGKKCYQLTPAENDLKCKKKKFQKNCRYNCYQCYPFDGVTSDCCYATYKKGKKACNKTKKDSECKDLVCQELPDCCKKKKKWGTICARRAEASCNVCFPKN